MVAVRQPPRILGKRVTVRPVYSRAIRPMPRRGISARYAYTLIAAIFLTVYLTVVIVLY